MRWRWPRSASSSARSAASRCGRRAGSRRARARPANGRVSSSAGCGSIRTRCAIRTPITVRTRRRCCSAIFPCRARTPTTRPGNTVFTCLSHDIVAHEVTHALLDGIHPRFNEPSNPDVHAFHEAFADIVAMFQHFSYPGVLRDQIARTRGDMNSESLLGQLAQQFGRATGRGDRHCAMPWARRSTASGNGASPTRARWRRSPSRMIAARSWSRRCSARSGCCMRRAPPTLCASPARGSASCRTATSCPISPAGSPRKPRAARRPCCRCAFARSTIARPSTSPSANTCARSSPPMSTSIRMMTSPGWR